MPLLVFAFLSNIALSDSLGVFQNATDNIISIAKNMTTTYPDRWVYKESGNSSLGWIYTYTQFINKYVPKEGVIFIPPQKASWEMEGNRFYLRWFIYPRKILQDGSIIADIPENTTHILIAHGQSAWGSSIYTWPRLNIPADKIESITFIDRTTLEEKTVYNQEYIPQYSKETWGVITLKLK